MTSISDADLTQDAFLGGKVRLWQPKTGYRAGVDPVLLAASVMAHPGQSVLDLGCGVGAAALCLGARVPNVQLMGVERQPVYAALGRRNSLDVREADLADLPADMRQMHFDHVITNPPYFDRHASTAAQDAGREAAMGEDTDLPTWIKVACKRLKPRGYLHVIHRAARLSDLLAALPAVMGSVEVLPLAPREGRAAELVILRARHDGRAPFKLYYPKVLHCGEQHLQDADSYTPEISQVLRSGAALTF